MIIGQIKDGIVLDHITAGRSMEIYNILKLDMLDCTVALIQNADSGKLTKKDIIKISTPMDLNLDVLGYVDPGITVNYIRDGKVAERRHLCLPERVVDIIKCKNPRCITVSETQLDAIFKLSNRSRHSYRCAYCDTEYRQK